MARGDGLVSRFKPSADDFELTFDPVEAPVASSRILVDVGVYALEFFRFDARFRNITGSPVFFCSMSCSSSTHSLQMRPFRAGAIRLSTSRCRLPQQVQWSGLSAFTLPPPRPGTPQFFLCRMHGEAAFVGQ
jgi:hypothetical protein